MIEDIEALLSNQPIKAKGNDWLYKVKKYTKRNPTLVGLSSLLVVSLLVFTLVYIVNINWALTKARKATTKAQFFQQKAEEEAKVSKQVSGFLVDLFQSSHPDKARGQAVTAEDILEKGFQKIKTNKQSPEVKTRLLITMSTTFRAFHQNKKAEEALSKASAIYEKVDNPNPTLLALLHQEKGVFYRDTEQDTKAIQDFKKGIKVLEELAQKSKEEQELLSNLYGKLAYIYRQQNNLEQALAMALKGLTIQR